MRKSRIWSVLIVAGMLACGGCSQPQSENGNAPEKWERSSGLVTSEQGGYMKDFGGPSPILYYMDLEQDALTWLCGKAECDHGNKDCNAYFEGTPNPYSLQVYEGKVYLEVSPLRQGNSTLYEMDPDGSNRKAVMEIPEKIAGYANCIRNDTLYIMGTENSNSLTDRKGVIYKQPLGADTAECIYVTEGAGSVWSECSIDTQIIAAEKKIYFRETRTNGEQLEVAIMEFSMEDETCRELVKESANLFFDIEGEKLFYHTYQYIDATGESLYGPIMAVNLEDGTRSETRLPAGTLEDVDEKYAYYVRNEEAIWMDIYDFDGKLVKVLEVPQEESEKIFVGWNVSFTDHLILIGMHFMTEDMDTFDVTNYDTYYVMPKNGIEKEEPEWIAATLVSQMRSGDLENVSYEMITE